MKGYDARLFDGPAQFDRNIVTLAVREGDGYLMPDGTWKIFPEGVLATEIGIALPRGAVEAIAQAIQEWQGHTSHADTEARILREWLAVERQRVDKVLDR